MTTNVGQRPERMDITLSDESEFFDYAYAQGWTDGLPVFAPTEPRVAAMLQNINQDPDEVVSVLAPRGASATMEHVAVNAVMAGCEPRHMPVLIAIVKCLGESAMSLAGVQATTSPATPIVILNGPVVDSLNVNVGRGCLGPGNRANATIGRAIRLLLINVGGGIVDEVDKATMGLPEKYTLCLGENEAESPWPSLAADLGYGATESTVTVTSIISASNVRVPDPRPETIETSIAILADSVAAWGSKHVQAGNGQPIVVLSPGLARILAKSGFDKQSLKRALFDAARRPADRYVAQAHTNYLVEDGMVLPCKSSEDIVIVVAGGAEPNQAVVISSFVDSALLTESVEDPHGI